MTLGKRIKQARNRLGLTQIELGQLLGVTDKAVSAWERDENPPLGTRFSALKSALKVTYKWLHEGAGDPPAPDSPGVILDALTDEEQAEAVAFIQFRRQQGGKAA